jgi:hypothetical protein
MQAWDAQFTARSKMFEPLRTLAVGLQGPSWPTAQRLSALAALHEVRSGGGQPLQFVAPAGAASPGAADYELAIHDEGCVPLRGDNWHDFFNALAWLAFPRLKAALNRAHAAELRAGQGDAGNTRNTQNGRSAKRDALTLFDESGVLVLSSERAVLDGIRAFEWKQVFCTERERLMRSTRFLLFGHGLYEKALAPYVGMTGHALLLEMPAGLEFLHAKASKALVAEADAVAATAVVERIAHPRDLSPLPVLGVPGWWDANRDADFYNNTDYFRPRRAR